jgi:hypothetical protein
MADQAGSAFEILGRIQVDLGALKTSLSSAEGEVRASAERQKQSYASLANAAVAEQKRIAEAQKLIAAGAAGAYAAKFGVGSAATKTGVEGHGEAFEGADRAAQKYSSQIVHLTRLFREATGPLAREFSPALAETIGVLSAATRSARFYGLAIGGAAVAAVTAGTILARYISSLKETADAQFELQQSIDKVDFGRAETAYAKATEALDRYVFNIKEQAQTFKGGWSELVRGYVAGASLLFGAITGQNKQIEEEQGKTAENLQKSYAQAKLPEEELERRKKYAELSQEIAKRQISEAASADDLTTSYVRLHSARRDALQAELESIDLKAKQEIARTPALEAEITARAAKDKTLARKKSLEDDAKLDAEERRTFQDRLVARLDVDLKIEEESARHAAAMAANRTAILDKERALQELEATQRGEVLGGASGQQARRSAELEARLSRETDAEQNAYAIRRQKLEEELKKGGPETERIQGEIRALVASHQNQLSEIEARGASDRSDLRKREAEDYASTWSNVTSQAREAFKLLENAGLGSTEVQVRFWESMAAAAKKGSREQIDALNEVAAAQKRVQEQGKSTIEKLYDLAEKMYGPAAAKRGFSLSQLEQAAAGAERAGGQALARLGAGGQITREEFTRAIEARAAGQQLREQFGGRAGAAFGAAVTPPEQRFRETIGRVAEGSSLFATADQLASVKTAWFTNFGEIEDYLGGFTQRVTTMMKGLGKTLADTVPRMSDALGRAGYLESNRGIAPQSVSR